MAVVAFINCDRPVIGLRLNQSHVMRRRMWQGGGGWMGGHADGGCCFSVHFICLSVGKTEVCVYVCVSVYLRRHKAQNNFYYILYISPIGVRGDFNNT